MNAASFIWWCLVTWFVVLACHPAAGRWTRACTALLTAGMVVLHFVTYDGPPCRFEVCKKMEM